MFKSLNPMHSPFYSFLFALFLLQAASVHAGRSSNDHSHPRRSLANGHKRRLPAEAFGFDSSFGGKLVEHNHLQVRKRQDDGLLDGLVNPVNQGLGDLGNGLGLGRSPTTALVPPTSFPPSPGPTSSSGSSESTSGSSSEPISSTTSFESTSSVPSSTSGSSSQPTIVVPSSTTEPPTSTSSNGGILDSLTAILFPPTSTAESVTESATESVTESATESATEPATESATESATDSSTVQPTEAPSSQPTEPPTSTSSDGGILESLTSILLPPTSSAESSAESITQPTEAPSSQPTEPPTSTSSDGGILESLTSILLSSTPSAESSAESTAQSTEAPSSQPTEPPTSTSSSDGGILDTLSSVIGGVTSDLSSVLNPPSSTVSQSSSEITPPPSSSVSVEPSGPSISVPSGSISNEPSGSISNEPSGSISSEPSGSISSEPSGPSSSVNASSSSFSISFPGGDGNSSSSVFSTESGPSSSSFTPVVTTTTSVPFSVNSDFSFILTESDLAFTSIPTTTSLSMTNPDEPTTTLSSISSAAPAATFTAAPLPAGLPSRIYPKNGYKTGDNVAGFTLISILFNQELNWPFVANDDRSSFQIFGYMPAILNTALGLSGDRATKTWMLQVYQPSSYRGPSDSAELGTTYLAYIPTDQVDNLAAMIKAPQSAFYIGVDIPAARSLALRVDNGFSVLSIQDPNGGDGGQTRNSGSSNSSGDVDRTRQDAIIGVVSALGAIAVLVLAFLGYKWYQRRQEAAHRRLSDPVPGARPEGREFDQDSVGGQRRRSFYFAEDSLRGYQQAQQEEYSYYHDQNGARTSPVGGVMTQRRNVVPAAISQPILRESSMNW